MLGRARRLAPYLLALAPFAFLPPAARADGEGDKPAEPPPPKKEKPTKDDTSIFLDWKIVKNRGIANAKDRGTYWEGKGTAGKDLVWLGFIWNRAEVYDKAISAWEQFLEWKPPEGTDKDSVKIKETYEKNREPARQELIGAYLWAKKYPEAVKAAEDFRKEFAASQVIPGTWDDQGKAHRLAGETDKAIEAFSKCAESKVLKGLFDLVDVYIYDGKVDEAKAAIAKYPMEGARQVESDVLKGFLDLIGTDAPSIEKGVSVGSSEAPTAWKGKATAVYYWHMQLSDGERRILLWDQACKEAAGARSVALSTYNKLNPVTQKIEPDMAEDKEIDWYKKQVADFKATFPASLVVPKDVIDGLGLKREGQTVIVDGEGKIRYTRIGDTFKYDRIVIGLALKRFAGG